MASASSVLPAVPVAKKKAPKQVVFVLGESVRWDMLNCYRETGLKTPNLDRLAAGGMRFEHAYNCQPVCGPARSAIFTGLYPHTNGMLANSMALGNTVHTIGQYLADRNVHTAQIGKWHLDGSDYFGTGRPSAGWDREAWYDMRRYLMELTPEQRVRSRKTATANDGSWTADLCFGTRVTDRAKKFVAEHSKDDFLLCVCYDEPHGPSLAPKEYSDMYNGYVFPASENLKDDLADKPSEERVWAACALNEPPLPVRDKHFFGSHTFADAELGRLLDQIEKSTPDAMIIYTSDHGVFLRSHRLEGKGAAMYDEITRVPFLVRWPGHTPENSVNKRLISHIDIAGTLMEFFGEELPEVLEGGSALKAFQDVNVAPRHECFIEWSRYEVDHDGWGGLQPIRCIRDERYKLSIHLMTEDALYDMQEDPGEMVNLIHSEKHAAIRNAMHDKLLAWMNTSRDPFRGYYWGRRSWRPEFPVRWVNDAMTRQRGSDGYLPRELDYDTGLTMKEATRPKSDGSDNCSKGKAAKA